MKRDLAVAGAGAAALAFSWREALRPTLRPAEERVFDTINGMHEAFRATWPIMQLGSFGGIPVVTAATYRLTRDPVRAGAVAVAGLGAYFGAKVVKSRVRRLRPEAFRPDVIKRDSSKGLGYPSGHAAESTAMAIAVSNALPSSWRWTRVALPATVGAVSFGRVYHGAHLPHDILGGIGLGVMIGTAINLGTDAIVGVRDARDQARRDG